MSEKVQKEVHSGQAFEVRVWQRPAATVHVMQLSNLLQKRFVQTSTSTYEGGAQTDVPIQYVVSLLFK